MKHAVIMIIAAVMSIATNAQKVVGYAQKTGHEAYAAGEELTYSMKYGILKGGEAHFKVQNVNYEGRQTRFITCLGKTTGLADMIFKVRDTYSSYIDPETELPLKAIRDIREGRYRNYDEVVYDRDSSRVSTIRKGVKPVPENAMCIVSAFFHARNNSFNNALEKGDTVCYTTYFADEIWNLRIKYTGKEFVKTKWGSVECYKFSPITEVGRAFETEDDMQVWISTDNNRLPIKIKFDLKVGSFTCELSDYKGLKHPWGK